MVEQIKQKNEKEEQLQEESQVSWKEVTLQYRHDWHLLCDYEEQLNMGQFFSLNPDGTQMSINDLLYNIFVVKERIRIIEEIVSNQPELLNELKIIKENVLSGTKGYQYWTIKEKR